MNKILWTGVMATMLAMVAGCATEGDELAPGEDETNVISFDLETMTDRCSKDVAIVPYYSARPETPGTVMLHRDATGNTPWTQPFNVQTGDGGRIRWWCHSTSGNIFDPGTWRVEEISFGTVCSEDENGLPSNCHVEPNIKLGSSAWQGWTPERSRCDSHTGHIRARLGNNRLLQIQCLE